MSSLALINIKECLRLSKNLLAQNVSNSKRYLYPYAISKKFPSALCSFEQHASFCTKPNDNQNKRQRSLPALMQFPEIVWPSFINTVRNWVLINFIIRPYFDNEFNIKDFIYGTKHAVHAAEARTSQMLLIGGVYTEAAESFKTDIKLDSDVWSHETISTKLVNSNLLELKSLVSQEALDEIKPIIEKLSVSQRKQLEINKDDIYLAFPYQVGIMFDESNENKQKRFVEITMVFHVLKGFREMQRQGEVLPWNMGGLPEYEDKVFICNYRFIKEFTVGSETDWTVNIINHFKPLDLMIDE